MGMRNRCTIRIVFIRIIRGHLLFVPDSPDYDSNDSFHCQRQTFYVAAIAESTLNAKKLVQFEGTEYFGMNRLFCNGQIIHNDQQLFSQRFRVPHDGGNGGVRLDFVFQAAQVGPFDSSAFLNIRQT